MGRKNSAEFGESGFRISHRAHLGAWWFPDLEGPDLSVEVIPGQHEAMKRLDKFSVAEIFSDDPEVETSVFGPDTEDQGTLF
jgi:hypothetical protein